MRNRTAKRRTSLFAALFTLSALATFCVSPAFAQPVNDRCQDAIPMAPGVLAGTTVGATADTFSSCDAFASRDVWFSYTPSENGTLFTSSCSAETDFQTVVSFHTECPEASGREIGCNDGDIGCADVFQASLSYPVVAGQTYYVRLSGFGGQTGEYQIEIDGPPVD